LRRITISEIVEDDLMATRLSLSEIESHVCDVVSKQQHIPRAKVHLDSRLVQDLNIDSLDLVDLLFHVEDYFGVSLPNEVVGNPAYKALFTRKDFRVRDFAELVYLQRETSAPAKRGFWLRNDAALPTNVEPFTQLAGTFPVNGLGARPLFEPLGNNPQGFPLYRRLTDGMLSVLVPGAERVPLGTDARTPFPDEHPAHAVALSSFLMDAEPVSTAAYCRFLNSIDTPDDATLHEWFLLPESDRRREHELLRRTGAEWSPLPGTGRFPMILVSWFGAAAYAQWANGKEWRDYHNDSPFLPSEAQWEYGARGMEPHPFPWGTAAADPARARFAQYERGKHYEPHELPLAPVNTPLGLSPFGLRHMAGNVWQWCSDWYAPRFFEAPDATRPNPRNDTATGVRAERGGSWIGPDFLCRSTYRRGRIPAAKGRCLGFRCISLPPARDHRGA
jgi:sulfatase modifying factor 1